MTMPNPENTEITDINELEDTEYSNVNSDDKGLTKDEVERCEMRALEAALPALRRAVRLRARVGAGTFSVVYAGEARGGRRVAVKHLLPTAHPTRIAHELRCLRDIGGKHNVIGVDLCLRHLDNVVFVMPFIPHQKFSEYVAEMDAAETAAYMRALLAALAHVHSFRVVHRDVKPANFLYDRANRRYMLVDFGLAHRVPDGDERPLKRAAQESAAPAAKRAALSAAGRPAPPVTKLDLEDEPPFLRCACAGAGAVCAACGARPAPRAPRAGTQGFRPPEVLLKVSAQTTAVDVWAAGVVLGSVLAARAPLLRARTDLAALAEVTQTTAVDVWAAGVVLGSVLAARAPLLRARTDLAALAEVTQTTAVDVWAAGVVLGSVLAARAPLLRARTDLAALAEVTQTTAVDVWAAGVVLGSVLAARAPLLRARTDLAALAEVTQTTAVDVWAAGVVLGSVLAARAPLLRARTDLAALAEVTQTTAVDVWAAGVVLGSVLAARAPLLRARTDLAALAEVTQTTAVDVWAAGVVLGSVLAARAPLLRARTDLAALAEMASLLGSARLAAAAARLRRRLLLPARPPLCLRRVCARLRLRRAPPAAPAASAASPCAACRQPSDYCLCPDDRPATEIVSGRTWAGFPDAAFSLLAALLEPAPDRRPSAARALLHPFLATPS